MLRLFRFLARWPLPWLHALGLGLGWLVWLVSPRYRRQWADHTRRAGVTGAARWAAVGEAGKLVTELPRLWFGAPVPVQWRGVEHIKAALQAGRGVLFLTPHLGCFEITAQAYAQRFGVAGPHGEARPITVLFRPPRQAAWRAVVASARARPGLHTAPTTLSGVRQLMQALRQGEAVGLLPDQVPPQNMGVWSEFWGQPAYTMTLWARLARGAGVTVLLAWGERLPRGRGYTVHVEPLQELLPQPLAPEPERAAAQLNQALERLIRRCPQQYLWGYARFKQPRRSTRDATPDEQR